MLLLHPAGFQREERTVTRLGFKGAMVNALTNGVFLDDERFWPIFERAQALDVPLYMHPAISHPAIIEALPVGFSRVDRLHNVGGRVALDADRR